MQIVQLRDADLSRMALDVLCGEIVILKDAVDAKVVTAARNAIFNWGQRQSPPRESALDGSGAVTLTSYLPVRSESRYIFRSFEFDPVSKAEIVSEVLPVFEALRVIYNGLLGQVFEFGKVYNVHTLLPQCIQYPRGGGFFQEHFHPILPQRIGLILSASTCGTDYNVGGARFRRPDKSWDSTEGHHNLGDVCLFPYDVGHDITPVDSDVPLNWGENKGRWSFVLPLKPAC